MKDIYQNLELVNNKESERFEMKVGEHTAFIEYKERPDKILLVHTQVPAELEGKGAGTAIIEKTLNYIERKNFKLVPLCPFVAAYIKRHPEWERIVEPRGKNI